MNLFLTGATGFLGSCTAEELIRRGHRVLSLVRNPCAAAFLQTRGAELIEGSLPDLPDLKTSLQETDAIIHIAGVLKGLHDKDFFEVNEIGTKRLAEAALDPKEKPKPLSSCSHRSGPHFPPRRRRFLPSTQRLPLRERLRKKQAGRRKDPCSSTRKNQNSDSTPPRDLRARRPGAASPLPLHPMGIRPALWEGTEPPLRLSRERSRPCNRRHRGKSSAFRRNFLFG